MHGISRVSHQRPLATIYPFSRYLMHIRIACHAPKAIYSRNIPLCNAHTAAGGKSLT
jgi:hypothetical protein